MGSHEKVDVVIAGPAVRLDIRGRARQGRQKSC